MISFHPLTLADKDLIVQHVLPTDSRDCNLSFMNLISWSFLYDTEVALHEGWLLFRFKADGHNAYMAPIGQGDWPSIMQQLTADAEQQGHPFLMFDVCEKSFAMLDAAMPGYFYATSDRSFSDYLYLRTKLSTLSGKKLQSKRNFVNRFTAAHPDYQFEPLTPSHFDECLQIDTLWAQEKAQETDSGDFTYESERRAMETVFAHWTELDGRGGVIRVDGKIIAFTYGAPINTDTFDVCVEKADTNYEGAFAIINRDFARSLPEQYVYLNREEDLGIEGLRHSKLSYHPELLLHKYTVTTKHLPAIH